MGKSHKGSSPATALGDTVGKWVSLLAADHDRTALIIAKTVGSLMIEDGPDEWFRLSRISDLTGLPPAIVAGILHRLRLRRRLHFERRGDLLDGVDHEYRFTIPSEMPERMRERVWSKMEVK